MSSTNCHSSKLIVHGTFKGMRRKMLNSLSINANLLANIGRRDLNKTEPKSQICLYFLQRPSDLKMSAVVFSD